MGMKNKFSLPFFNSNSFFIYIVLAFILLGGSGFVSGQSSFDVLGTSIYEGIGDQDGSMYGSQVYSTTKMGNSTIFVGGYFNMIAGKQCRGLAMYEQETRFWTCLINDSSSYFVFNSIFYHPFLDLLIVAGPFSILMQTPCDFICMYNRTSNSWIPGSTTSGLLGEAYSITADTTTSTYYACGKFQFINANGASVRVNRTVIWDGTQYLPLGDGLNNDCNVLAWDSYRSKLFAGGIFTASGTVQTPYLAMWNGVSWSAPFLGSPNGLIRSIRMDGIGNILFGGSFTTFAGQNLWNIARLDPGDNILAVGIGMNGTVYSVVNVGSDIYAGGSLEINGSTILAARFRAGSWSVIAKRTDDDLSYVQDILVAGDIYFAGTFRSFYQKDGSVFCGSSIARYMISDFNMAISYPSNWTEWHGGMNGPIVYLHQDSNYLVIGGAFSRVGNLLGAQNSAYFRNGAWHSWPSDSEVVYVGFMNGSNFVYGGVSNAMQTSLLQYDFASSDPSSSYVDGFPHVGGQIIAVVLNESSGEFYVGGSVSGPINYVGMWNGTGWNSLSKHPTLSACNNVILTAVMRGPYVYFGGAFGQCGPDPDTNQYVPNTQFVARYSKDNGWEALSNISLQGNYVYALAFDTNGRLYLGGSGRFLGVNNSTNIVAWEPSNSSFIALPSLADELTDGVYAVVVDPSTNFVYIAGRFLMKDANGLIYRSIAFLANNSWVPFVYVDGPILFIKFNGTQMIISGQFGRIDGVCAGFTAAVDAPRSPPTPRPTPKPTPPTPKPTPKTSPKPTPTTPTAAATKTSSDDTFLAAIISGAVAILAIIVVGILIVVFLILIQRRRNRDRELEKKNNNIEIRQDTPKPNSEYTTMQTPNTTPNQSNVPHEYIIPQIKKNPYENPYLNMGEAQKMAFYQSLQGVNVPFDHLEIVKQLGTGNFGVVNLVRYKGKLVAAKQLKPELGNDDSISVSVAIEKQTQSLKEFVSEAKLLAKIPPSPYVISLVGICPEPFVILTEYLDGGSLHEYLSQPFAIKASIGTQFLKEILLGVMHLHKSGVIHRDLAARNVLLRNNPPNAPQCVLTDMGLARLYDRESTYQKTKSATFPLKWSAPELLGEKRFSEKSDIWSWAVVSIEIFSRQVPFPDYTPVDFALALVSGRIVPTPDPHTPEELIPLLNLCFRRMGEERPSAQQAFDQFPKFEE